VEERKLCPLRYYANCVSTTLTVLILHNVESVYFVYSTPVFSVSYTMGTNSYIIILDFVLHGKAWIMSRNDSCQSHYYIWILN